MIDIEKIDHVGIRVRDEHRAVAFYEALGFAVLARGQFHKGHPIIMRHPSGVVINLLGPALTPDGPNILMDVEARHAGYTHMALRVTSLEKLEAWLAEKGIEITGRFAFADVQALFIRDPDRNVIEFDAYPNADPATRTGEAEMQGYEEHP